MTNDDPGRALSRREPETLDAETVHTLGVIADNMGNSGLFPDAKTGKAAFAKIMLGRSLGLGAAQAMTGIHVVKGNVQIAATTLAGFVREHPSYDYQILEHDETHCKIRFVRLWPIPGVEDGAEELGVSEFSVEDAARAELGGDSEEKRAKSQWGKYPRNMVFARAMSNGVKWYCPDLFGGVPIYTEGDEFEDRPTLGAGLGGGEAEGIPLPPAVEAVLERAEKLGHAALANRGAVETVIGGIDDEERIAAWVERANADLNRIAAVEDADVLPADDDAQGWRARAEGKLLEWRAYGGEDISRCVERGTHKTDRAEICAGCGFGDQTTAEALAAKHEADTALQTALNIEEGGGVQAEVRRVEGGEGS